jgi:alanine dehydrogenase
MRHRDEFPERKQNMLIGVPKEIKDHEYRIGVTPGGVAALTAAGHKVLVQRDAATRIGFGDDDYKRAGADIVASAQEVYVAEMIVKVKEIQRGEWQYLREGQLLFCYLHLAPDPGLTDQLLAKKIAGVAYETVEDAARKLPLLAPMSAIAGRLSIQVGAWALQMANGGNGTLLAGVPGVAPGKVLILGGGSVGTNAAKMALGLGADTTLLDISQDRLRYLDDIFGGRLKTGYSDPRTIETLVRDADLVVGAVLLPGTLAPKILTRAMLTTMKRGSVFVDVAIDQGGCAETSRPTSHSDPLFIEAGVVHYCVPNMPGATARTSTLALTQVTLPYALAIANLGLKGAIARDPGLRLGVQLYDGRITHADLARDLKRACTPVDDVLR